jgi:hypothetical protein
LCAILAGTLLLPTTQASATEDKPPAIESISTAVGGEVIVRAQINPEGLESNYEIKLECRVDQVQGTCEPIPAPQRVEGVLVAGDEGREVSLTLTGLQAGSYWFGVSAGNSAGEVFWRSELNIPASPSAPENKPKPFQPTVEPWAEEVIAASSARLVAKAVEEREARERQVKQEREAEELPLKEAQRKEAEEQEAERKARDTPLAQCVVPVLKGRSLNGARSALHKAHCSLGTVTKPGSRHGALVVIQQSAKHGKKLHAGIGVAVTLGPAKRS